MKFTETLIMAMSAVLTNAAVTEGGHRMDLTHFAAETGAFTDSMHDTKFTIKEPN